MVNFDNFVLDEISVKLEDISDCDDSCFDVFLKNNTYKIGIKFFNIVKYFYSKIIKYDTYFDLFYNPYLSEVLKGQRAVKFCIVKCLDDYVFLALEFYRPLFSKVKGFYIKMYYRPVSYNGSKENEISVLNVLSKFSRFKYVIVPEKDICKGRLHSNNYYNTCDDFYSKYDKSKYKSKHMINRLSSIIDVRCDSQDDIYTSSCIKFVLDNWVNVKKEKYGKSKILSGLYDYEVYQLSKKLDSITVNTFLYKDVPVGYSIVSRVIDGFSGIDFQRTVSLDSESMVKYFSNFNIELDDDCLRLLLGGLGRFVNYWTQKNEFDKGQKNVYIYSGTDGSGNLLNSGLGKFKNQNYCKSIYYNQYSLDEYLCKFY